MKKLPKWNLEEANIVGESGRKEDLENLENMDSFSMFIADQIQKDIL